uniref:CSON003277 protein n=1 Tax=Culicoides sonorensis TaxID=179676 RepID=A0A336MKZ7_CULSO
MNNYQFLFLLTFSSKFIFNTAQFTGSSCYTYLQESGQCVNIRKCRTIWKIIIEAPRPLPDRITEYIRNSQCGNPQDQSICCRPQDIEGNERPIVTKRPLSNTNQENRDLSSITMHRNLNMLDMENCGHDSLSRLSKRVQITESHFCAGGEGNNVDTCSGDSGGPIQVLSNANNDVRMVQYGIVSFGPSACGSSGLYPGVYTDVSSESESKYSCNMILILKKSQIFFIILLVSRINIVKSLNESCFTYFGEPGQCVKIQKCIKIWKVIIESPKPLPTRLVEYIRNSQCGIHQEKNICCRLNDIEVDPEPDRLNDLHKSPNQDVIVTSLLNHPNLNFLELTKCGKGSHNQADISDVAVKPICLPFTGKLFKNTPQKYIVTGWGNTEKGSKSNKLLKAFVTFHPKDSCQKKLGTLSKRLQLTEAHFCAGGEGNNVDTCSGDSGGPIQALSDFEGDIRMVLYGIVSFGPNTCGYGGTYPGVYTDLRYFLKWILDNISN